MQADAEFFGNIFLHMLAEFLNVACGCVVGVHDEVGVNLTDFGASNAESF